MKRPKFPDLEPIIRRVEKNLRWRIEHKPNDTRDLEILSSPDKKTHLIHWPNNPGDPVRGIEYLHELAHAVLSERNLFLAGGLFDMKIENYRYNLIPAVRAADDWWADYLLDTWCPDESRAEIAFQMELFQSALQGRTVDAEHFFGIAEIIAEGIHYLGADVRLPDHLQPAVAAFLAHDPGHPSRQAAEEIIQALFDVLNMGLEIIYVDQTPPYWTTKAKRPCEC